MIEFNYLKEDTRVFLEEINKNYKLEQFEKDFLMFLTKKLLFLKEINLSLGSKRHDGDRFYTEQLISDIMYLIRSYLDMDIRYYYLNIRSIIESFSRLFNKVELGTNRVTMTVLLDQINRYISRNHLINKDGELLCYPEIKSLYSKSCLYVHGSVTVKYTLIKYYEEIEHQKLSIKYRKKIIKETVSLFNVLLTLSSYRFSQVLNNIFFREKFKLNFFIGKSNLNVVKNYSNLVIICKHDNYDLEQIVYTGEIGKKIELEDIEIEGYRSEKPIVQYDEYLEETEYIKINIERVET